MVFLRVAIVAIVVGLLAILLPTPLHEPVRAFLFDRKFTAVSQDCLNHIEFYQDNVPLSREMTQEERETFERDGVVVLREILPAEWLQVLRMLWMEAVQNPSAWDVLYTRLLANFYGAQKSVFLHHSSLCGQRVAQYAPTTQLVRELFQGTRGGNDDDEHEQHEQQQQHTVRVMEPNVALLNYPVEKNKAKTNKQTTSTSGHTSWHRDDVYMPFRPISVKPEQQYHISPSPAAAAVRLWIPLVKLEPTQIKFMCLKNSAAAKSARLARNVSVEGTDFSKYDKLQQDAVFQSHIVNPGTYFPGDVLAFAADTPHFAQSIDCSDGACPRMILSYASDTNAVYDGVKKSSAIPLYTNQVDGKPLQGAQFPRVDPWFEEDWKEPFRPTYKDILQSLLHAMMAGSESFYGFSIKETFGYVQRVTVATVRNVWKTPTIDVKTGELVRWS